MHRWICGLLMVLAAGCRPAERAASDPAPREPHVAVVNAPLKYFAEQIAGGAVDVVMPIPADRDPAHVHLGADAVRVYQSAELVLLNGAGYAHWVGHASLPLSTVVDTSHAFHDRLLEVEQSVVHRHGPSGEHAHTGLATHTWLDPELAELHARAVYDAMTDRWPEHADRFRDNYKTLSKDLRRYTERAASALRTADREAETIVLASHPVYQYLGRFAGWKLRSVHWEPERTPSGAEWDALAELHKQHPARIMLWEATPNEETAQRLASMGIEPVVFYPCGNLSESGDFPKVMQENLERLAAALPSLRSGSPGDTDRPEKR